MRIFGALRTDETASWIEDNLAALVISVITAAFVSIAGWLVTIFIGAKLFRDEWTYGVPLAFGIPAAMSMGLVAFVLVFKKLR